MSVGQAGRDLRKPRKTRAVVAAELLPDGDFHRNSDTPSPKLPH